jgi:hypothetical protein
VIIDDLSNLAWPDYCKDAEKLYNDLGYRVLFASNLDFLHHLTRPWVRQQTIKLYADQILDTDQWFFCDGDCVLLAAWPDDTRSAHPVPWGELSEAFCDYVGKMFDVSGWSGRRDDQDRYVTTSAPPTRDMHAKNLQQLRSHVFQLHGKEIWELHVLQQRDPSFKPSEWELMDYFDLDIQRLPIELQNLRNKVTASWDCDRQLGIDVWQDLGIPVSQDLWQKLPLVRYL